MKKVSPVFLRTWSCPGGSLRRCNILICVGIATVKIRIFDGPSVCFYLYDRGPDYILDLWSAADKACL